MKPTNSTLAIVVSVVSVLAVTACLFAASVFEPAPLRQEPIVGDRPDSPPLATRDVAERRVVEATVRPGGFYSAPLQTELRFRYAAKSSTLIGSDRNGAPARIECSLAGQLVVAVVARERDELVVEMSFPGTAVDGGSGGTDATSTRQFAEELARPMLVHMRDDGTVLGIRFAEGTREEMFNWLRSLVAATRFAVHEDQQEWSCEEADAAGVAEVRYRWERLPAQGAPGVVVKQKLGSRGVGAGTADLGSQCDPLTEPRPEVHAEGRATLDAGIGWFTDAELRESMRLDLPDASAFVESSFAAEFHLESSSTRSALPAVAMAERWDTMDGRETARACNARKSDARLAAELANVSVSAILQALDGSVQAVQAGSPEQTRLIGQLAALVRLRPEVVGELQTLLSKSGWRPETLDLALVAVAHAGTEPAQAMLAGLMADARVDPALRFASVRSVFAIGQPGDAVLTQVALLAGDPADATIRNAGFLALGCAAGRVVPERRADALAQLHALAADAGRRGELGTWFEALGNAGLPECVSLIEPYRNCADENQRAACLAALRRVPDQAALTVLARAADSDVALSVRTRALVVLGERGGRDSIAVFERAIARETDGDALGAALRGLAGHAGDPAVRQTLRGIAAGHASADARRWAQAALASRS